MRGGLGKTLLLAFLLLAIVPLSLMAFLTYHQIQRVTRQKLIGSLETMVALKEAHLVDFVRGYERELALLARASGLEGGDLGVPLSPSSQPGASGSSNEDAVDTVAQVLMGYLEGFQATDPTLTGLVLLDAGGGDLITSATTPDLDSEIGEVGLYPATAEVRPGSGIVEVEGDQHRVSPPAESVDEVLSEIVAPIAQLSEELGHLRMRDRLAALVGDEVLLRDVGLVMRVGVLGEQVVVRLVFCRTQVLGNREPPLLGVAEGRIDVVDDATKRMEAVPNDLTDPEAGFALLQKIRGV